MILFKPPKRDAMAAKRFLKKTVASYHATKPSHSITHMVRLKPILVAIRELKKRKWIYQQTPLRCEKIFKPISLSKMRVVYHKTTAEDSE
ncbi:hypothetical protein CW304_21435 [Bacillus sp. UFRGS-B20]|nr:hypothetical protein CW304_21435 [Bacillus sp. UFRGS-B20]